MPNLIANRTAKADRWTARLTEAYDAEAVARFTDSEWEMHAVAYAETIPSEATRAMILDRMFSSEGDLDPFRGLL